jgi:hypothetical protein
MVSGDGNVSGIIDWESAAFYPRFYLPTKLLAAGAFNLESKTDKPGLWGYLLSGDLETQGGYKPDIANFRAWRANTVDGK